MSRAAILAFAAMLAASMGAPAAAAVAPDYRDSRSSSAVAARSTAPSPSSALPSMAAEVPVPTTTPLVGVASWYCETRRSPCTARYAASGAYAAAGPALRRNPAWRGSYVVVRHGDVAVRVQLVDWCECPDGRVLDLYGSVFRQLAPLSRGLVTVEVAT